MAKSVAAQTEQLKKDVIDRLTQRIESLKSDFVVSWSLPQVLLAADSKDLKRANPQLAEFFKRVVKSFLQITKSELKVALDARIVALGLVDTGKLKSSLSISTSYNVLEINYTAPGANLLHYGGYILPYGNPNAKKVYIPGRPWVQQVLDAYDFKDAFMRALNQTT